MKWRKKLYIALIAIGLGLIGTVYLFPISIPRQHSNQTV